MKANWKSYLLTFILITLGATMYFIKNDQDSLFHLKLLEDSLVKHGNGLIMDDSQTGMDENIPFASKYYFKGKNVNNYFMESNICFRIINITSNNSIKLVYSGTSANDCTDIKNDASKMAFSFETLNRFKDSDVEQKLKEFVTENKLYNSNFPLDKLAVKATWYLGNIKMSGNKLSENIEYERGLKEADNVEYQSYLGLVSITDYLKAGCAKSVYDAIETCGDDNYLYNEFDYYTMNSVLWDTSNVYTVTDGMPKPMLANNQNYYVYPTFYLKANLKIIGEGTAENPYKLK